MIDLAKSELNVLDLNHKKNENILKYSYCPRRGRYKKCNSRNKSGDWRFRSSLFASDLFKMYEKVCNKKNWKLEIITLSKSDAGGLKEVIASIKGKNIYSSLKYEVEFIVFKEFQIPKPKVEFIHQLRLYVLPEAEDVDAN